MKTYGDMEVELHTLLFSPLDRGEWSASCTSHLAPREEAPFPIG